MADYILNEGSTGIVGCWFKDENEKNVVPSEITWRVDDAILIGTSAGELVPDTVEIPTSYKHTLYVPADANRILDEANLYEEKVVTIRYTYGDNGVGTEEFRYRVKNLARIPLP